MTGSTDVRLVRRFDAADVIRKWREQFGIDVTAELRGHAAIGLYECSQTGLRFFRPADVAGSDALYAELGKLDWYYEDDKWEYRAALADFAARIPGGRVMEVGCGRGTFVKRARAAGLDAFGIEISAKAVDAARAEGLPVELLDLADAARRDAGRLDAVCAFQVLEHVPDVRGFLEHCVAALRPGGVLAIGVPNGAGFMRHTGTVLEMPPHHMSQWTPGAFESLGKLLPVRLVRTAVSPLRAEHAGVWAEGTWADLRARRPWARWLFNRATRAAAARVMRWGVARRWARGHTLYALLEKVG
ncbi:MAG TPA: class I SAM-dependent methyltransferase [Tepidisphaeraceae bacterium]|nr:class I SAM-dependent methyltransferase [Tepidisphaeraceae bacterium]